MEKVLFYEKDKGGHRDYIISTLENNLKADNFLPIYYKAVDENNTLLDLYQLVEKENIRHVHLLTLDDCLEDFTNQAFVNKFKDYKFTISGNLFRFSTLHPLNLLYESEPNARKKYCLISRLIKDKILAGLTIPDERVKNRFSYPLWGNRIVYLPDFPRFVAKTVKKDDACRLLNIDEKTTIFLFYGKIKEYKGVNLIVDIVNRDLIHSDENINIIIAGDNKSNFKIVARDTKIKITEINEFINEEKSNLLFSAADCILLPYKKDFKQSSGTFVLAAQYGKFFIVPEKSYLSYLSDKYNCGYSFKAEEAGSLAAAMMKFINNRLKLDFPVTGSLKYSEECKIENYVKILKETIFKCYNKIQ